MNKHFISVIICSYNRCERIKDTLDSLLLQEFDKSFEHEIIVVDNNSKDRTKEIVKDYIPKFHGILRYVFESKQGLSFARNRGIKEAKGQIIAFTDDDCLIDKLWLRNIVNTFLEYNADCVFGKIIPKWEGANLPKWLERNKKMWRILGTLDYGENNKLIDSEKFEFYGSNFSIKKEILSEIGLFNTELGRKGTLLLSGEDTEFFNKLLVSKKRIVYNPKVYVHHKVQEYRTKKRYFIKWHFFTGVSLAYRDHVKFSKKKFLGVPLWFLKESIPTYLEFLKFLITMNSEETVRYGLKIILSFGVYVGCFKRWLSLCQK
jgi:glycosyltransferase involved in cell wall biosynthesis